MFINESDFNGFYRLPDVANNSKLIEIINRNEVNILIDLLGLTAYKEFIADLDQETFEPQSDKWIDFVNGKEYELNGILTKYKGIKEMLISFCYVDYISEIDYRSGFNPMNPDLTSPENTFVNFFNVSTRYNIALINYCMANVFMKTFPDVYDTVKTKIKSCLDTIKY